MKLPTKYWVFGSAVVSFIVLEICLRVTLGLGNPVLLQADPDTGYRFRPNQKVFRFGKWIQYNQYSQRSEPITPDQPKGKLRILMTGDSILNGGSPIDQSKTITELFETKLVQAGESAEVLNASAGSWGVGNQLAYLRKFGLFQSDVVIVEIGANDLAQPTSTSRRVGHDPNYPDQRPLLAIEEVITRYLWPHLPGMPQSYLAEIPTATSPAQQAQQNRQNLQAIVQQVRAQEIPILVVFVPQLYNLIPRLNTPAYKSEFLDVLEALQVPVIDAQVSWSRLPPATISSYFRDNDHLTETGNQAVADLLFQKFCLMRDFSICVSPESGTSR